jgi:hypothetical protein
MSKLQAPSGMLKDQHGIFKKNLDNSGADLGNELRNEGLQRRNRSPSRTSPTRDATPPKVRVCKTALAAAHENRSDGRACVQICESEVVSWCRQIY